MNRNRYPLPRYPLGQPTSLAPFVDAPVGARSALTAAASGGSRLPLVLA